MTPNLLVYYNIYPISKRIVLFKKITLHKNLLFGLYLNSNKTHLKVVHFCRLYFEFDTILIIITKYKIMYKQILHPYSFYVIAIFKIIIYIVYAFFKLLPITNFILLIFC